MPHPDPTQDGVLLAHLRHATRPAHNAIEGALGLLDDGLDLAAYRNILLRLHGFWSVWQPQVAHLMADEAFLAPRRRLHLLAADLAALGVTPDARARCCPPVPLQDAMAALGSLYVTEGSTLGGRVILKNVQRRLGPSIPCAYFHGYGAGTGAMWLSFLARLNAAPLQEKDRIAQGAVVTFERLGSWLTGA